MAFFFSSFSFSHSLIHQALKSIAKLFLITVGGGFTLALH